MLSKNGVALKTNSWYLEEALEKKTIPKTQRRSDQEQKERKCRKDSRGIGKVLEDQSHTKAALEDCFTYKAFEDKKAYVDMMINWAGNVGYLDTENTIGGKRIPKARKVPTVNSSNEFEERLVYDIYKALIAT